MKNIFVLIFSFLTFIQLNAQKTHFWYVADKKISCEYGDVIMACLMIKADKDSAWKNFPHEIRGFIFEQGVEARIEVLETSEADSTGKLTDVYTLVKTLETRNTVIDDKRVLMFNKWRIVNLQELQKPVPVKKMGAYLAFQVDSGRVSGFSGCNSLNGRAEISDGMINFGSIVSTCMSCEHDAVEKKIHDALVGRSAYYVRNNILFIIAENGSIVHLRPEKKLDSIINIINTPLTKFDGNTYFFQGPEHCGVRLDYLPEIGRMPLMFMRSALTAQEKEKIIYKLKNVVPDHLISEIHILKKENKKRGMQYAKVFFKDGTSKEVEIRQVQS